MEANQAKYFVDGFLIKHFGVWPAGVDKADLFHEQKIFLIYLLGNIPGLDEWNRQIDYKTRVENIKKIGEVTISKTDIDLARLQGRDVKEIKLERLKSEKEQKLKKLNSEFGIEEEKEQDKNTVKTPPQPEDDKKRIWDLLQGKGLIKNGLQDKI